MAKDKEYESVLVIVTGLVIWNVWTDNVWVLYLTLSISVVSILIKPMRRLIVALWFKLAHVLGFFNSKILLTVVYYFMLTPIAWLKRILQSKKRVVSSSDTFFVSRDYTFQKKDFEKMW